ncbi:hypothetical protein C8T65DRAFT_639967 [Cerioporus squamosus]|nr:hypothetical protein C8T65DRAFT_639967 [Cerioporus squamosus]
MRPPRTYQATDVRCSYRCKGTVLLLYCSLTWARPPPLSTSCSGMSRLQLYLAGGVRCAENCPPSPPSHRHRNA